MNKIIKFFYLILLFLKGSSSLKRYVFSMNNKSQNGLMQKYDSNYTNDQYENQFEVKLSDEDLIKGKKFFIILESQNPNFILSILNTPKPNFQKQEQEILIDMTTHTGNIVFAMGDTYFKQFLLFFRQTGSLRFFLRSKRTRKINLDYSLRVEVQENLNLQLGKSYTSRLDSQLKSLKAIFNFNGENTNMKKLRFQLTAVRQKQNFSLQASLSFNNNTYQMNNIFKRSVGGILTDQFFLCKTQNCKYEVNLTSQHVKTVNIESFIIGDIEDLDVQHFEEYYDRTYEDNVITYYKLPYVSQIENMNVSISLIPVTSSSGLYINARTKPIDIQKSDWKEEGPLSKRLTIKWSELEMMKATQSDLYIAVKTSHPGEFLIKIDAHEEGYKGRLSSGVTESGFVKFEELNAYMYIFDVIKSQDITFSVVLNIVSGDADLFLKKCKNLESCRIQDNKLAENEYIKSEQNSKSLKEIKHTFTCEKDKSFQTSYCQFLIIVKGKENHGTHYELSLREQDFHHLMIPGHFLPVNLQPKEKMYLKFSNPDNTNKTLFLSIEAVWGSFALYMSREIEKPSKEQNQFSREFQASKTALLSSQQTINFKQQKLDFPGIYFITIEAESYCTLNLKFFNKSTNSETEQSSELSLHTLTAGSQMRGEITSKNEILYYSIKISLDQNSQDKAKVYLTPLKGTFDLFANQSGILPTKKSNQFYSQDNILDLPITMQTDEQEYIIGVALNDQENFVDKQSYQFIISFAYESKPLKLTPGILTNQIAGKKNLFLIEVRDEMEEILIVKTLEDGYQTKMCASFTDNVLINKKKLKCEFVADNKTNSIFIAQSELNQKCKEQQKCNIILSFEGNENHQVSIGFVYNDYPFHLVKGKSFLLPSPIGDTKMHFIYHPDPEKPLGLFFDSKGRNTQIFTSLTKTDDFADQQDLAYPNKLKNDSEYKQTNGYIRNIFYPKEKLIEIGDAELLITVQSTFTGEESKNKYDQAHFFLIQTFSDSEEIIRTHSKQKYVTANEWTYFNFYNNGNQSQLNIYISTEGVNKLTAYLSKGLQQRPPFTGQGLKKKTAIGMLQLSLEEKDLKKDMNVQENILRGHFVLAIQSSHSTYINIYWNQKEDLNYIELTPLAPMTMFLEENKNFYFQFFAQESEKKLKDQRAKILIYIKTNVEANIWIVKSEENDMPAPSSQNYMWKSSLGKVGGLTAIEISPDDSNYCLDCNYFGHVETKYNGSITIVTQIKHSNIPINLTPGNIFVSFLKANESQIYKVFNPDSDLLDLTVQMLQGYVDVYVSDQPDVSVKNYKEVHALSTGLENNKFIVIAPAVKYNINGPHDFYILINNPKDIPAKMYLDVDKNSINTEIQSGLRKYFHLAPGETTNFFHTPKPNEDKFQVQLELTAVFDSKFKAQALSLLNDYIDVYHVNKYNDRYVLKYTKKSIHYNRVFIEFDISYNTQGTFTIHIYNPVGSGVALSLDLLNESMSLLHSNETNVDYIEDKNYKIYEAYGRRGEYLYFDLKMCQGDVEATFYEKDYDKIASKQFSNYQTIKSQNSFIHYFKLKESRVFMKLVNKGKKAFYKVSVFNRISRNNEEYSEITMLDEGKVYIEVDENKISFQAVKINSNYSKDFFHVIDYKVFLSDNFDVMRYAKNCGRFMIDQAFEKVELFDYTKHFEFLIENASDHKGLISLTMDTLNSNTKYYGVVVAQVQLFPVDKGQLKPIRENLVYYDEFIIVTQKYQIPLSYVFGVAISLTLVMMFFIIIKSYVFGDVRKFRGLEQLSNLKEFDEASLGRDIMLAMEQDYFGELKKEEVDGKEEEESIEQKLDSEEAMQQIELVDQ